MFRLASLLGFTKASQQPACAVQALWRERGEFDTCSRIHLTHDNLTRGRRRATVPDTFACLALTTVRGGAFALLKRRRAVSIFALSAARAGRHIQIVSAASIWPIRREVNREPIEIERRMNFAE